MPAPFLRPARAEDAPALAKLHVRVWRETYRALAPPEAYAALNEAKRLAQWQKTLAEPPPSQTIVLEAAGDILGLIAVGPARQAVFGGAGEICHLYLLPSARGRGAGTALLHAGLHALHLAGFTEAALAVVEGNTSARAFYARAGGREGARFVDQGPLWRSQNLVVHFSLPLAQA